MTGGLMNASKEKAKSRRTAGLLLHPTSLPGPYGIGDLGPAAYGWVDALASAGQTWWQVLPLGPTGAGDSPYQSPSSFAGNPLLISPEMLARDGLLGPADTSPTGFPRDHVEYGGVTGYKDYLVKRAWDNFQSGRAPGLRGPFEEFSFREGHWVNDYTL